MKLIRQDEKKTTKRRITQHLKKTCIHTFTNCIKSGRLKICSHPNILWLLCIYIYIIILYNHTVSACDSAKLKQY